MADERVRIVHEDGRFATVPAANLAEAQKLGWRQEQAPEQAQRQRGTLLESAGQGAVVGTVGMALAAPKLVTALGSAAIGAQDPLANLSGRRFLEDMAAVSAHLSGGESEVAGREMRESIMANEEANPASFIGGELGGMLLGSGGVTGGAKALGGLAARGAGALGAGTRAAKLVGGVSTGVLEGAAFGADAASEAAWVKNAPATAQQSLAAIGLGALFGGGISLGASGLSKLPAVAKLLRRGEAEGIEGAVAAEEAGAGRALIAAEEKAAPAAIDRVPEGMIARAKKYVSEWSDEEAIDAIARGNKGSLKKLGGGEFPSAALKREKGALAHEMGILAPGLDEAGMHQIAKQQMTRNGSRMGTVMEAVDKEAGYVNAQPAMDKLEDIARRWETEGKFAGKPEGKAAASFIRERMVDLQEKQAAGIVTHSDLHNERMYFDSIGFKTGATNVQSQAAREVRAVISDTLKEAIEQASPELRREWDQANARYGVAKWATDTLGSRVAGNAAGGVFGLKDLLTGGAFAAANPMAAIPAALGSKFLRERGASTFASIAKKLAGEAVDVGAAPAAVAPTARKLSALVAHSTEQVENGIGNFLGGVRGGTTGLAARATSALVGRMRSGDINDARAAYADHVEEVQKVATSPDVAADRMATITGSTIPLYAPGLHAEMVATATRGAQYLASVAPAPAQDPNTITPQVKTPPPVSSADMRTYAERVEGVENPLSLLSDMNSLKGVRAEKVEAVKAVHPELFEQMRQSLFTHLAERTTPIPKRMRTTLEITFDAGGTIDPSMSPQNLGVMKLASEQLKAAGAAKAKAPAPKASGMLATRSNQISGGPR